MNGVVTSNRDVLVRVKLRGANGINAEFDAILDTGFSEYLTLPQTWIAALALPQLLADTLSLAGGSSVQSDVYDGVIVRDGQDRSIPIHRLEGSPLLGMGLLWDHLITMRTIDGGPVTIAPLP